MTLALLKEGHSVTVISSNSEKQKTIEAIGAISAIGSLEDVDFIASSFANADVVYCMVPPANYFDHSLEVTIKDLAITMYKQSNGQE